MYLAELLTKVHSSYKACFIQKCSTNCKTFSINSLAKYLYIIYISFIYSFLLWHFDYTTHNHLGGQRNNNNWSILKTCRWCAVKTSNGWRQLWRHKHWSCMWGEETPLLLLSLWICCCWALEMLCASVQQTTGGEVEKQQKNQNWI